MLMSYCDLRKNNKQVRTNANNGHEEAENLSANAQPQILSTTNAGKKASVK